MTTLVEAQTPLRTYRVASGLSRPLFVTHPPGDFERIFIVEQNGKIKIRKNGQILVPEFINLDPVSSCCGERGLLGLAFHPNYATNGYFFVNYTNLGGHTVIARYSVSADPDIADPAGSVVMTYTQPDVNHNGGWLAFGPDGYLYIGSGDGGGHNDDDPGHDALVGNGQSLNTRLGKILRVDVNGDDFPADLFRNYAIPPTNPLVGLSGDDEIWAYGLRNPWRCAFDRLTHDLYIADVGEERWEEINVQPADESAARNYGWRCMEGNECTSLTGCTCNDPGLTVPVYSYPHSVIPPRCSITGGEVYRGCAIPDLDGTYFFADYCSAEVWSFRHAFGAGVSEFTDRTIELDPEGALDLQNISSFGLDAAGEMYVCDLFGGEVFKIVPDVTTVVASSDPPADAIDARRPIDPVTLEPIGWERVQVALDPPPACLTPLDISVVQQGGVGTTPLVSDVVAEAAGSYSILLNRVIRPLAWTTIRLDASSTGIRLGSLPGDVTGDRISDDADVAILVSILGQVEDPVPDWTVDIDRSGSATPADILELVDLLNGAGDYDAYFGATLP